MLFPNFLYAPLKTKLHTTLRNNCMQEITQLYYLTAACFLLVSLHDFKEEKIAIWKIVADLYLLVTSKYFFSDKKFDVHTVFPYMVSALEQFPHLNSFRTFMYCDFSRSFLQRQKVITSKSLSKNLSNVNKLGISIHFLSRKQQKLRFFDVIIVD